MWESSKMLTTLTIALLTIHESWGRQQQFLREPTDVTAIAGQQVRKSFEYYWTCSRKLERASNISQLENGNQGCVAVHSGGQGGPASVD